jgi:hypothetical protein
MWVGGIAALIIFYYTNNPIRAHIHSSIHIFFAHIALRYDMHIPVQHAALKHHPDL